MEKLFILLFAVIIFLFWLVYRIANKIASSKLREYKQSMEQQTKELNDRYQALSKKKEAEMKDYEQRLRQQLEQEYFISSRLSKNSIDYLNLLPPYFPLFNPPPWPKDLQSRLFSAVTDPLSITGQLNCSATIIGSTGKEYKTSLVSCTCPDFIKHRSPCKHMLFLSLSIGCPIYRNRDEHISQIQEIQTLSEKVSADIKNSEALIKQSVFEAKNAENSIEKSAALKRDLLRLVKEKKQTYPWLASLIADLYTKYDADLARELKNKRRPAVQAAKNVQSISKEYKAALTELKKLQYQISVYESAFPFLEEFKELPPDQALQAVNMVCNEDHDYDHARDWLSKEEYANLSQIERDQIALDRYLSRKKTNWEAGIEYEQYVGYLCEQKFLHVSYSGALKGLEDMGRDLIITDHDKTIIIQCKRWSIDKTIHEKHIFQLYGSVMVEQVTSPQSTVVGTFITTATLSDLAKKCADALSIHVIENFAYNDFPRIKCNISKTGEKIYHLPFDQQYNRVVVERTKGEFYVNTVSEAHAAGFRRAFRWHSS